MSSTDINPRRKQTLRSMDGKVSILQKDLYVLTQDDLDTLKDQVDVRMDERTRSLKKELKAELLDEILDQIHLLNENLIAEQIACQREQS